MAYFNYSTPPASTKYNSSELWRTLSLMCFMLVLANPFSGLLPITASLGQRIAFAGVFLWFIMMSILVVLLKNKPSSE